MTPLKDGKQEVVDDDDGSRMDSTVSRGTYEEEEEETDPFAVTYNYCEDLIYSIGNACGFATSKNAAKGDKKDSAVSTSKGSGLSAFESWEQYVTDLIFRVDGVSYLFRLSRRIYN